MDIRPRVVLLLLATVLVSSFLGLLRPTLGGLLG